MRFDGKCDASANACTCMPSIGILLLVTRLACELVAHTTERGEAAFRSVCEQKCVIVRMGIAQTKSYRTREVLLFSLQHSATTSITNRLVGLLPMISVIVRYWMNEMQARP